MAEKSAHPSKAFQYIDQWNYSSLSVISDNQIIHLKHLFIEDMKNQKYSHFKEYLSQILNFLPGKILPFFLENLVNLEDPEWYRQNCLSFLIHATRPIYQIKGIKIIQKLQDESLIPLVFPLIFHSHPPLQKEAIKTLLLYPLIAEPILENSLKTRSRRKREIVLKVLHRINPQNLRLAVEELNNPDFLIRIRAIQVLGKSRDRKWLSKLLPFLNDSDLGVRKAVIEAISDLGGKKAKKILNQSLIRENYPPLKLIIQEQLEKW
ncbi:MAG: hypothetical protein DRO88_09325 [Promethearchaeia archaeon]|nr:MAG: hypothetical protein DRO88_09325 [Candidatus Lokiarchaeia archaeon]